MFNLMGLTNGTTQTQTNVSCTCNCKHSTSFQSMEITQLEFVQILVMVVVMMVMVVVITCLLNHYRLSARSLLSRHDQAHRTHLPLANEGSLWSSEGAGPRGGLSEVATPRPPACVPSFLQRETHTSQRYAPARFQPTYPYLPPGIIDLPPTISLSDGEEPPPYQGPSTLQLRNPEQQLELNRESVRAPPNRTVYDSHLLDSSPCLHAPPPSVHAGISAIESAEALARQGARVDGPPPAYSEVSGHYYHPSGLIQQQQHQTGSPPASLTHGLVQSRLPQASSGSLDNTQSTKMKHPAQQV